MKLNRAAVLLVAVTCTACTSVAGTVISTTAASPSIPIDSPSASVPDTSRAHVGDMIEVDGDSGKMDVTVSKVQDVHATDGFSTPPAGDRYVGVQVRFTNTGTTTFSDAINNEVTVQDGQGQTYQTDIVNSIDAGPTFPTPLNLAGGGTALGWVVLDVPTGTQVAQVQVTLSSGFGNGGVWLVP